MGSLTKLLYNSKRKLANVFSVKLTNNDKRKNEKKDCKNKMTTNPSAMLLAKTMSLFLTQSINIPMSFGNARAVAPVISRKTKPT